MVRSAEGRLLPSGRKNGPLPTVIIANTIKGKGVSYMEGELLWHYRNPNDEQLKQALEELA